MKKFKWTIIIAVVFVIFLGYYYIVPRDNSVEGFESLLGNVEGKTIDEVVLGSSATDKTVMKENDTWYVVGEEKYVANQALINDVISKLSGLESIGVIETDPEDLEKYKLDPPMYKLFIKAGESTQEIHIGNMTPSGDCYFVKLPDKKTVYKVGKSRLKEIVKPVDELRTKQIFIGKLEDMKKIEVIGKGKELLALVNDGIWKTIGENSYEVEEEKLITLIEDLHNIRISEYHNDSNADLAFYGLADPSVIVTITYNDGSEEKLELGSSAGLGEIYGRRGESDTIFSVPYEEVEFFERIAVVE